MTPVIHRTSTHVRKRIALRFGGNGNACARQPASFRKAGAQHLQPSSKAPEIHPAGRNGGPASPVAFIATPRQLATRHFDALQSP